MIGSVNVVSSTQRHLMQVDSGGREKERKIIKIERRKRRKEGVGVGVGVEWGRGLKEVEGGGGVFDWKG